jgi:hypothetical protein
MKRVTESQPPSSAAVFGSTPFLNIAGAKPCRQL